MRQIIGLLTLFVGLLLLQTVVLRESFAASDGGALIQLAASRPVYRFVPNQ
jgi:hypothetical protein